MLNFRSFGRSTTKNQTRSSPIEAQTVENMNRVAYNYSVQFATLINTG